MFSAFTKFVKSQIEKGKVVDTQIIGLFSQTSSDGPIHFYPTQEYLDNGKFKLPKFMRNQMTEAGLSYEAYYSTKLEDLSLLNFGSLAQVCNLQDEQVK